MVQLLATAAIEYMYVAACGLLAGGIFVRGAYARSPQVQCVCAQSRLSVSSIVAWRTNKQTNKKRQTRPSRSAGSRPPLPKFSRYVEVEAHYIFQPSTICVRPLFTELGPKNPPKKADFAMKQTNICRLSGDINHHPLNDVIAMETLGPINDSATDFLDRLGQMISAKTNEVWERMYLYLRISSTIQCFNAVLLHETFSCSNDPDLWPPFQTTLFLTFFISFNPRDLYY